MTRPLRYDPDNRMEGPATNTLAELTDRICATGDRRLTRRVRQWRTPHGAFAAFYFVSERAGRTPVEVYAVRGVPTGRGPFPGILHYHGGGQTANPDHVETLVRLGYACVSFDWTGPAEGRRHVTRWGHVARDIYTTDPTRSWLVHCVSAARQALTLLADHPRVDPTRLGVFGISWGGYQTWLLNGIDPRLRAAVAIYGCGRSIDQMNNAASPVPMRPAEARCWRRLLDPASYAAAQHGPLLFLNGTNDFFGWMDTAESLERRLDARHRVAFEAHQNHCMASLSETMLAWFDTHLKGGRRFPDRPAATHAIRAGKVWLCSPLLGGARDATFFVASKDQIGPARFWRPLVGTRRGRTFEAKIALDAIASDRFSYYVHQVLARGIQLSSFPRSGRCSHPARRRRPVRPAGPVRFPLDPALWYAPVGTEPFLRPVRMRAARVAGRAALVFPAEGTAPGRAFAFNTRLLADPRFRPPARSCFQCTVQGPIAGPVTVALLAHAGCRRERRFEGQFTPEALGAGVPLSDLRDPQGHALRVGSNLSHLYIGAAVRTPADVALTRVGWQPA